MGKTVLILGAGASKPYGLPTAAELKALIVQRPPNLYPDFISTQRSRGIDLRPEGLFGWNPQRFVQELQLSGNASIDAWLGAHQSKWAKCYGTLAIATTLLRLELPLIGSAELSTDWHAWLFQQLKRGNTLDLSRMDVITFNYDCLLEWSLAQMAANSFQWPMSQALNVVRNWNVLHVYGSMTSTLEREQAAMDSASPDEWAAWSHNWIQLADDRNVSSDSDPIRARVWSADRLLFVGFGFDSQNLLRLGIGPQFLRWQERPRSVFATAYRLTAVQRARVYEVFGADLILGDSDEGGLRFLQNRVDL